MCVDTNQDGTLVLKLTDFGSCKTPQDQFTGDGMTPEYLAPEVAKVIIQKQ